MMQVVLFLMNVQNSCRYVAFSSCFMRCRTKTRPHSEVFAYFSSHQNIMKGNSQNYSIIVW